VVFRRPCFALLTADSDFDRVVSHKRELKATQSASSSRARLQHP
jgi:hypothetical protein